MGKCISKSSVLVTDVSRNFSEKSKQIKQKLGLHDYTRINESKDPTIRVEYSYEDDDDDVIPDMDKNRDEIDDIFDDDEIDNKI